MVFNDGFRGMLNLKSFFSEYEIYKTISNSFFLYLDQHLHVSNKSKKKELKN